MMPQSMYLYPRRCFFFRVSVIYECSRLVESSCGTLLWLRTNPLSTSTRRTLKNALTPTPALSYP